MRITMIWNGGSVDDEGSEPDEEDLDSDADADADSFELKKALPESSASGNQGRKDHGIPISYAPASSSCF